MLTFRRLALLILLIIDALVATSLSLSGPNLLGGWLALNVIAAIIYLIAWAARKGRSTRNNQYGIKTATLAGDQADSIEEKRIADYFHRINLRYQIHPTVYTGWKNRFIGEADFLLLDYDVYVEYWGMVDVDNDYDRNHYVKNMKRKMAMYHRHGIKFVSLYPSNLGNLDWIFKTKFRKLTGIDL